MSPERFVSMVASLTMDGETLDDEVWDMECEDAIETLRDLIAIARGIAK